MEDDNLKVLLIKGSGTWVALCLNYDMVAQGETWKSACEAFNWTYWTQIMLDKQEGVEPFSRLKAAPEEYWKQFEEGVPCAIRFELKPPFNFDVDRSAPAEEVSLAAA